MPMMHLPINGTLRLSDVLSRVIHHKVNSPNLVSCSHALISDLTSNMPDSEGGRPIFVVDNR